MERHLDNATRVLVPLGTGPRAEFARTRATAAALLARRRDVERLSCCLTTMALRAIVAVRALLWERGDFRIVVDTLLVGLEHARPAVRARCAEALDHFGDERCFEPLRRLVLDAVPRVRRVALHALNCDTCKLAPLPLAAYLMGSRFRRTSGWEHFARPSLTLSALQAGAVVLSISSPPARQGIAERFLILLDLAWLTWLNQVVRHT